MNVIEEIIAKLQNYPQVRYESRDDWIRVLPTSQDGFPVELFAGPNSWTIHFKGWHESFSDKEEALNCFAFGLSTHCRLKVARLGRLEYKWTVESFEEGQWVEDSTTGLLIIPFWRKNIRYFQNEVIPGPS